LEYGGRQVKWQLAVMACAASLSTTTKRPTAFYVQLNHVEQGALREVARFRKYAAGTRLVLQGDRSDRVLIVVSGWVKVTVASKGGDHDVVLAVRGPGDIVGESPAVGGQVRSATVTSLGEVSAMVIPAEAFIACLDEHPRTWRLINSTLTYRLEETERRLQGRASADGNRRLASRLVELAEGYGSPGPDGSVVIPVPLSQQDLASWGDASRKTMVRALRVWRQTGMIATTYRRITILDLPGLRRLAGALLVGG
jgi:CRP/FNR family cyclic AMP-dependent transcriptional regulator